MRCPYNHDDLVSHTTQGEHGVSVTYATCPTCRGYFLTAFDANYLPDPDEQPPKRKRTTDLSPSCPVCETLLAKATGDNMPPTVTAWRCPHDHGYFFPEGELTKFKKAQQSKITYFKHWNIPIGTTASVLLAGFAVVILSVSLIVTVQKVQQPQVTAPKAADVLTNQQVVVSEDGQSVAFAATTNAPSDVLVHIDPYAGFVGALETTNGLIHVIFVEDIPSGRYTYYFTITTNGNVTESQRFILEIP